MAKSVLPTPKGVRFEQDDDINERQDASPSLTGGVSGLLGAAMAGLG